MAELLRPGVFIREVTFGPQPIEGVSTSTAGFVGVTERGLTEGPPTLVTSLPDFERAFGGAVAGAPLWYAIRGFFENGGRRAYVARIVSGTAARAALAFTAAGLHTALVTAPKLAATPGLTGEVVLSSVAGVALGASTIDSRLTGAQITITITEVVATSNVVRFTFLEPDRAALKAATPANHFANLASAAVPTAYIAARDPGLFGNRVSVLLEPVITETTQITAGAAGSYTVASLAPFVVGDTVQVTRFTGGAFSDVARIDAIDAATKTVALNFRGADLAGGGAVMAKIGFRLTVLLDGAVVEVLDGLSGRADGAVAPYRAADLQKQIADRSRWITIREAVGAPAAPLLDASTGRFLTFDRALPRTLASGGDGGAIIGADVIGTESPRTGLKSIEAQQGVSVIAAPGMGGLAGVIGELLAQCERTQTRFAVFESTGAVDEPTAALAQRGAFDSKYAAMYYPWVNILDPISRGTIAMTPVGHVLGAYARTDNDRGVWKAPASVPVRGILGFTRVISDGEQEILNPAGVNALRRLDGLGDVIWGARTISSDGLWRYVPVRRLFIFLEESIVRGTRFAVFEPNDQKLWARLRDSLTNFLTTQWRAGALFGETPEEAFFVKVDETTTTQDDRDNGRVNILIGIAPVKPAEFVVFQIGQAPNSVIIAEQS